MNVRLTSAAWRDLDAIGDWIAQSDPHAAVALTDDLLAKSAELSTRALHYPAIFTLGRFEVRKRSYRGYVIIFRIVSDVEVMHIVHHRQDYLRLIQDL